MDATLLPIDIHSNRLTEWLVTRRVCERQWLKDVTEARRRLQLLADSDMDKQGVDLELQTALQQTHGHYWHYVDICDALKRIEAANKSVLFGYSSAVIRELDSVLKLLRRKNCYLTDAARLLNKTVQEDAPFLKRQAERQRRRQAECERKRGEHAAAAADARAKFLRLCKQLGLQQQLDLRQVRKELIEEAERLPDWYDGDCMRQVRECASALELYDEFVRHSGGVAELCPTLRRLLSLGNCTQFEFARGRRPQSVEPFALPLPLDDLPSADGDADDAIDWDAADAIDFGIEEINVVQEDAKASDAPAAASDDNVASGESARSALDTLDIRERLLDDLHELDAFFGRLEVERADHANSIAQALLSSGPALHNAGSAAGCVRSLLADLQDPTRRQFMLVRSSPACLTRLLSRFRDLHEQAEKSAAAAKLCDLRQEEAAGEEKAALTQLASLRGYLAELKGRIEADISQRHDGRRVNIMGEVNAV